MALDKIKIKAGRLKQLEIGTGNNAPARASDVNPIIDYMNSLMGENASTASASSTPTINARSGYFTTASLSTAAVTAATLTLTNSYITTTSIIHAYIEDYSGTLVTNGIPVIVKIVPSTGSAVITLVNVHASNALSGTLTIKFIIL